MKKAHFFSRAVGTIAAHKIWTAIVAVIIITGGYFTYRSAATANAAPEYVVTRARMGSIIQTVTGTGQVSASNQIDIASQVSGAITGINVKVGQHVSAGTLIATIDPKQAAANLESARLSLSKLVAPPKTTDLANAENSLSKAYGDGFNSAATLFLDMPTVMSGEKDLFYGQSTFLADQQSSNLIPAARAYRADAVAAYDKLVNDYAVILDEYKGLSRSSATSSIDQLLADAYTLSQSAATVLQKTQNTITFTTTAQPTYLENSASSAAASVNSWSNTINGDVTSLLSAKNSIDTSQNSLTTLQSGADPLDIRSQQLSLQQQEETYANYFIRAPFAGIVGRIPVNVYQQAGNGTVIATLIGDQKIATISLNEVDAAKVHAGDPVNITLDAIDGLNATGTVSEVDLVGTVNQGVVTYNVKISISTSDSRILPGMSVNASIIANRLDNVLVIPAAAIKTVGNTSTVQIFTTLPAGATSTAAFTGSPNTSGNAFRNAGNSFTSSGAAASSTRNFASSTRQFNSTGNAGAGRSITISSKTPPENVRVTLGASDDSNAEVLSGLTPGSWVVTKTISTGTTATAQTTAPSLLGSLGGGARTGAGGNATFRATGR